MVLCTGAGAGFARRSLGGCLGEQRGHRCLQAFFEAVGDGVVAVGAGAADQTEKGRGGECIVAMVDGVIGGNEGRGRIVLGGGELFGGAGGACGAVVSEVPPGGLNPVLVGAIIGAMMGGGVSEGASENRFAQGVLGLVARGGACSAAQSMLIFGFGGGGCGVSHAELESQVEQVFGGMGGGESVFGEALRRAYGGFCLRSEVEWVVAFVWRGAVVAVRCGLVVICLSACLPVRYYLIAL